MSALLTALFLGAVVGSIYSLSAYGLVLTYRSSGVFNFAHGAVGMLFAYVYYQLVQGGRIGLVAFDYDQTWHLPTGVALALVVVVLAPLFGWVLDLVLFRRLRDAGEVVKIVATIGLLVVLQGAAGVMWGAATTLSPTSIFSTQVFTAGGFRATLEQISSIAISGVLAVGLVAFLRYSPLGVRMRAVVDRAEVAELAGVDSARVSGLSWAIGTSFGALSGILLAPFFGSLDPITLTFFVVTAAAAAVAGRLQSFPLTLAGAYGIGMAQLLVGRYASGEVARQVRPAIPFLVLFALLFLPQWRRRPTDRWTVPPLPPVIRGLSPRDAATRIGIVTVIALVAPFVVGEGWQLQLARVPAIALIFLSLVVVSGFGGQVSLCQAALAGVGAFVSAHLIGDWGFPFWGAVILGGLAVVPMGVFLALRAVALSPLFLGFATLAFGAVMDEVAFNSKSFSGGLAGVVFERPGYLQSPRTYYIATLALFGAIAFARPEPQTQQDRPRLRRDARLGGRIGRARRRRRATQAHRVLDLGRPRRHGWRAVLGRRFAGDAVLVLQVPVVAVPRARRDRRRRELARRVRRERDLPARPGLRARAVRPGQHRDADDLPGQPRTAAARLLRPRRDRARAQPARARRAVSGVVHPASQDCETCRGDRSRRWCRRMPVPSRSGTRRSSIVPTASSPPTRRDGG